MEIMYELDVRGLSCPLPILRTKKVLTSLSSGQRLRILSTDRAAPLDFERFCRQTGHILCLSQELDPGVYTIVVELK